ncbi:SDR family oxidoreductase [Cronobacter dublinensis]
MQQTGNTILITGGGTGIGKALAHRLHDAGNTVIIAGRRVAELERAAEGRELLHIIQADLSAPQGVASFAEAVQTRFPALNVLINNAGIMRFETLTGPRDLRDAEEMIATNLLAPLRLIDAFTAHLCDRPDSAIINVSSGLAFVPLPAAPTYCATKAALHSLTVSLRERLRGKVEVIEIIPPGVQTGLTPGQEQSDGYQPLDAFADEVMSLLSQQPTPPEILVEAVKWIRFAEAQGRYDEALALLNQHL